MAVGINTVSATNPIPDAIMAGLTAYPAPNPVLAAAMPKPAVAPTPAAPEKDSPTAPMFKTSASTDQTKITDPRNDGFMLIMYQLMVENQKQLKTQNPSDVNDLDFASITNQSIEALQKAGIITPDQAIQLSEFTSNNLGLFREASSFQFQGWSSAGLISNDGFNSQRALSIAGSDNAGGGYCARGTRNILVGMGFNAPTGNAEDWDQQLSRTGWVRLRGVTPGNAPEGSLLFYDSDDGNGRRARNNGGGKYGHVEVVAEQGGERLFVSDKARRNAGGSVPDNFEGAFIYVGRNAPEENYEILRRFNGSRDNGYAPQPVG
jgi:hypothetical protein